MSAEPNSSRALLLPCPECRQPTDSLNCYTTGIAVILIVGAWWQRQKTIA